MKIIIAVVALALAVNAAVVRDQVRHHDSFEKFKAEFSKEYETEELEAHRRAAFHANLEFIAKHNREFAEGLHTYEVGVNQFTDLTNEEWRELRQQSLLQRTTPRDETWMDAPQAGSVDWRTKGAVTPIKNQGQCGSCWSFSTTGSTEGAHQIASGKLVSLSEQQLMDCSTAYGNQGCNGGLMDNAFKYIIANGGLDTEEDYPYTARDGTCNKAKAAKHAAAIKSFTDVPHNNEKQLAAAVEKGPVSVAIEADQQGFQMYKSGVFSGPCGTQLDHGVLAVGYTADYWIVKNSWGATWGDKGYIMMKRGVSASGICGIAMEPSYPVVGSGPSPPSPPPPPGPSPPPPPPPGPASYHYEDPNAGGCQAGEEAVQIQGLSGSFCSPTCSNSSPCPTDVPPNTTARPECILEAQGSSSPTNCALVCQPGENAGGCPAKATCKPISVIGLCTYDS